MCVFYPDAGHTLRKCTDHFDYFGGKFGERKREASGQNILFCGMAGSFWFIRSTSDGQSDFGNRHRGKRTTGNGRIPAQHISRTLSDLMADAFPIGAKLVLVRKVSLLHRMTRKATKKW